MGDVISIAERHRCNCDADARLKQRRVENPAERNIDFASVRACTDFEVIISATNVEAGKVKVSRAKN